jgi:hypothetical protein
MNDKAAARRPVAERWVCVLCRVVLPTGACPRSPKHPVVNARTAAGTGQILREVWGTESFRRQSKRLAGAGGSGAGIGWLLEGCGECGGAGLEAGFEGIAAVVLALVVAGVFILAAWLIYKFARWLMETLRRPLPCGALVNPRRVRGETLRGLVEPLGRGGGLTVARQLRFVGKRVFSGDKTTLLVPSCTGFAVKLEDGRRLVVAAGTDVRIIGPERELPTEDGVSVLDDLDPRPRPAEDPLLDPFPFDKVLESGLRMGDTVMITGAFEMGAAATEIGSGYRASASAFHPKGALGVRVLRESAGDERPPDSMDPEAHAELEDGEQVARQAER